MNGRQPPHSPEAERSVLGGVITKPAAFHDVAVLLSHPDDFFLPQHRAVWEAMVALDARGTPIDIVPLGAELAARGVHLEGGAHQYLIELANAMPVAEHIEHYARLVQGRAHLRRLITVLGERAVAAHGEEALADPARFVDATEADVFRVTAANVANTTTTTRLAMPEYLRLLDERRTATARGTLGVRTGFRRLDRILGGLMPGQLVLVAARPGVGKTAFGLHLVRSAAIAQGLPTFILSMEMRREALMDRMLAAEARYPSDKLRRGLHSREEWAASLERAASRLWEAPITLDDQSGQPLQTLAAKIRRWAGNPAIFPPAPERTMAPVARGLVVIDYIGLITGEADELTLGKGRARPARDRSREQDIGAASRGLKVLAKDINMPIVALAQLNREIEKRANPRPRLSDLRESGSLEQDADVVLFLYRESMRTTDEPEPEERRRVGPETIEIIVGKQREGESGARVQATLTPEFQRFDGHVTDEAAGGPGWAASDDEE